MCMKNTALRCVSQQSHSTQFCLVLFINSKNNILMANNSKITNQYEYSFSLSGDTGSSDDCSFLFPQMTSTAEHNREKDKALSIHESM